MYIIYSLSFFNKVATSHAYDRIKGCKLYYAVFYMFYQIKNWVNKTGAYVPFLQVFCTTFFTGVWSFILFSAFLFLYAHYDRHMTELLTQHTTGLFIHASCIIVFFEGSAISLIVGFINMQYFRRYEEGETKPIKKNH